MARRTSLLLCALACVLAGCGVGRHAAVLQEHTVQNGANADLGGGSVQVRDVFATPADVTAQQVPAGGALDLHFHVYNGGDTPELMVANAPALITGVGVVAGAVAVPAHGQLWVGGPGSAVTASIPHAPQPMWVGTYLPLTLQFNNAGHVDLTVPIEDASDLLS